MPNLPSQVARLAANRARILRYGFAAQIIAAIPFLAFGYYTGHAHARLLLKGARAQGTIVELKAVPFQYRSSSGSTNTRTIYEPVVEFAIGDHVVRFQEWKGSQNNSGIGSLVPVLYDPAEPSIAMTDRGVVNWLPWAPCVAIGLFLAVAATKGLLTLLLGRDPAPNLSPSH